MIKFLLKSALLVGAAGLVLEGLKTLEEEQEKKKEFHIPKTPSRFKDDEASTDTVSSQEALKEEKESLAPLNNQEENEVSSS